MEGLWFIWFLLGLCVGAGLLLYTLLAARRSVFRLTEDTQRLREERTIVTQFLHDLAEATGRGDKRTALLERVAHAATMSTNALSACVFVIDEDAPQLPSPSTGGGKAGQHGKQNAPILKGAVMEGLFSPLKESSVEKLQQLGSRTEMLDAVFTSETYAIGEGLVGTVAKERAPIIIANAAADPRVPKHTDSALAIQTLLLVPIKMKENLLGVLGVMNSADGVGFTQQDVSLVEALADQAGMAIHNADLLQLKVNNKQLDLDLSLARNIQGLLLPTTPETIEGIAAATFYWPAQQVGGDLYEAFPLGPHKMAVAIGDVSGKGIPASLLMAICITHLRHFARSLNDPAEVLRALNGALAGQLTDNLFVSFAYGVIDTQANTLTLARAGQEPPLFINAQGQQSYLKPEGMAVGLVPPAIFGKVISAQTTPFNPGDTLILYTDGLTEARNTTGEEYGNTRFEAAARRALTAHAKTDTEAPAPDMDALCKELFVDVVRHGAGEKLHDDVTLVAIRRT